MTVLGYDLTYLELFGSIFSLASVILAARANIWNWAIGIVGQIFLFLLFMNTSLYGNMLLQVFFTGVCLYGWYYWGKEDGKKIKTFNVKQNIILYVTSIILCIVGSYILSFFEDKYIILDASITVLSVIAVFLLSKKYLDAWILWIIVDILSIILFYLKGMNLISLEYILITGIAIFGLINWIKLYGRQVY